MDALLLEKKKDKVFDYNDIVQKIREICHNSKRKISNIKDPAPALSRGKILIYLNDFEERSLSRLILRFFFADHHHNSSQPAFTCSKLTKKTLEKGVKYVQS